eukprot:CAMPEP_0117694012 /NCGR_PEP_ID=MMETSP0804-20121206/27205_1 /TAXON_ID=1074897 /ORGANISM="Tetraselmis astigmatica, Strain CCMP880" /LENGTH=270 /DNA_ID=CAMNT_0005507641 /DNA_START=187 /DNA_END=999 /DNA_ORIENTATION=-
MAANFWVSNQCKELLSRDCLRDCHAIDYAMGLTDDQIRDIKNFHVHLIVDVARNSNLRQRVSATASVYFRRFYSRNSFSEHDPRLVSLACLFLAAKAEECTVQMRLLKHYLKERQQRNGTVGIREVTEKEVLDYELLVLEELGFNLIVFHPYHPLEIFVKEMIETAWAILNDAYYTNLHLIYAPYMLAIGAIYMASVVKQHDVNKWMSGLRVDMKQVYAIAMELLNLFSNFRTIISQDECYRLLEMVQEKGTAPSATAGGLQAAIATTPS